MSGGCTPLLHEVGKVSGEVRRMGCGPLLRRKSDCTSVAANLYRPSPAFRTPSAATWHLPRFAETAETHRPPASISPRRLRRKAEPSLGAEPHERAADIGGERAVPAWNASRSRSASASIFSSPIRLSSPPAGRGDPAGEHALDDRDRRGEQRAGVDRAVRAEPRLDLVRHPLQRLVRFRRAAGEARETLRRRALPRRGRRSSARRRVRA